MRVRVIGFYVIFIMFLSYNCVIHNSSSVKAAEMNEVMNYDIKGNEVYVTGLKGRVSELIVPATIDGKPVVSIKITSDTPVESELNLSACKDLRELVYQPCETGTIEELNLSNLRNLKILCLKGSNISQLNLRGCTGLEEFYAHDTLLENLDLTSCSNLRVLQFCEISPSNYELDLSGCPNLEVLYFMASGIGKINLENCIKLKTLDIGGEWNLKELGLSNCRQLVTISLWMINHLERLDASGCTELQNVNCVETDVQSLDFSNAGKLYHLNCSGGKIRELNLTGCVNLQELDVSENQLTRLEIPDCMIEKLICNDNQIAELVLGENMPKLKTIICENNRITSLHIKEYPKLRSVFCDYNQLTSLTIDSKLDSLHCRNNQLETIELKYWEKLESLGCDNNQISGILDLRKCRFLKYLTCSGNRITKIQFSPDTYRSTLQHFNCSNNKIEKLDISMFSKIGSLYCQKNKIRNIKFGKAKVKEIRCFKNPCYKQQNWRKHIDEDMIINDGLGWFF